MHDLIQVCQLGLRVHEIKLLKSIFMISPKLKDSYELLECAGLRDLLESDVIIVNADDETAVRQWEVAAKSKKLIFPIFVGAAEQTQLDGAVDRGEIRIKRPIKMALLVDALEHIIHDRKRVIKAGALHSPNLQSAGKMDKPLQVLVVDDSFPVRQFMEQKLSEIVRVPMHVSFAASGEEALLKLKGRPYDLVFLDVVMEGVDGYKVCKEIKKSSDSYVVMLTSKKSTFDKVRGAMSGCNSYITKPPQDQRLSMEVENCLNLRLAS
ncbi:MAG: response regulator [Gammaproteobacteria bacterium]|nr:response regulator [Gammaproteobacteria bacterium]